MKSEDIIRTAILVTIIFAIETAIFVNLETGLITR